MLTCKKILCALLACVTVAAALCTAGCSTPKIAATIDGQEYSTGEYLAYLYSAYASVYQQYYYTFYYYSYSNVDYWTDLPLSYGDGDDARSVNLSEYIQLTAQDNMVYIKALENKLKEYNLSYDETKKAELENNLKDLKNDQYISYGFNNENYKKMVYPSSLAEYSLFYGLYDHNGPRAMSEQEIRAYFDTNFLSYKLIELSLVGDDNADMTEEQVKEVTDRLQGYLDTFNATGKTGADFEAVIKQFNADQKKASETETTETETETTTETETETETETDSRVDVDATAASDEDLAKAVQSVAVGSAQIVKYKKNGTTNTAALIFRMDPTAERAEGVDYFADKREDIISSAKYDEFRTEMKAYAATLERSFNKSAVKACDPQKFERVD